MRAAFTRSLISLALLSSQAAWATPFQPYTFIGNADNPLSITSADFNGDGDVDLAVTSYSDDKATTNEIKVLLGAGDTTFGTAAVYPTGLAPSSIASAELNNIGDIDLAVANSDSNNISVFINAGSGTFAGKVDYTTDTKPVYIVAAELNAADIDLVTANSTNSTISVLINNNDGTFAAKVDYATGTNPSAIAAADFDGVNEADLAVTNKDSDTVSVFINNGAGVFAAAKVDYPTGATPTAIASQDISGDNFPDLVISNSGDNTISVLINNGDGTFAGKVDYPTGTTPMFVSISDLNNDTFKDVAVSNSLSDTISVFTNNNGTGAFLPKSDFSLVKQPGSLTVADIDSDTHPELIATGLASYNFSYLKNLTAVTPDSFSFTSQTDVQKATKFTSNEITLSGLASNSSLSILGDKEFVNIDGTTTHSAEYSIDGGSTFTSSSSTVSNGTKIRMRLLSSSSDNTTETVTITIGGFSTTFSVTTAAANTTPTGIIFSSVLNAEPNTTVTSESITWTSAAVSILIVDGEYSLNSAAFTSTPGTINPSDTLRVRLTSSATYGGSKQALISFDSGGQTATFDVFTKDAPSTAGGGSSSLSIWFSLLLLGALLLRYKKDLSNQSASLEPQSRIKYR